jgi:hypothetical protein
MERLLALPMLIPALTITSLTSSGLALSSSGAISATPTARAASSFSVSGLTSTAGELKAKKISSAQISMKEIMGKFVGNCEPFPAVSFRSISADTESPFILGINEQFSGNTLGQ